MNQIPSRFFLRLNSAGMLAVFLLRMFSPIQAQVTSASIGAWSTQDAVEVTQDRYHTSRAGDGAPYRLFLPENFDPAQQYPLVLVLHGNGSKGTDNVTQLNPSYAGWMQPGIQAEYPSIILVPQMPSDWAPGSFSAGVFFDPSVIEAMRAVEDLMDRFYAKDFVDRSRIYVHGASKGGAGTWDFAMRNNDIVAAALPMMGYGDPNFGNLLVDVPIWASHGVQDVIVPVTATVNMIDAIATAAGDTAGIPMDPRPAGITGLPEERLDYTFNSGKTKLSLYPLQGHGSNNLSWQDPDMINWTFAQSRSTLPRAVGPNTPPTFTTTPVLRPNAVIDQSYLQRIDGFATDTENDPLFFEIISGPAWLSMDMTGVIRGSPSAADLGLNSWTFSVYDGRSDPVEATLEITVQIDTIAPAPPTGLIAVAGNSSVGLVWEANTEEDISTYNIYRSATSGLPGISIVTGINALAFNDSTAVNGTTYFYTVTAVDLIGNESAASGEVTATPDPNAGQAPVGSGRETFSYDVGALNANSPPDGSGFAGSWLDGSGGLLVVSGSLTAPSGYGPAPSGNSIRREGDGFFTSEIGLAGENQLDFNAEGVFYISYLFRTNGAAQGLLELLSGGTRIGTIGKESNSSNLRVGLGAASANARLLPLDTDMLIVARIETRTVGDDRISASFFTTSVGGEPLAWDVEVLANITATLDTLRFYNGAVGTYVQYDELRLGPSFESVTREPSTGPDAPANVTQVSTDSAVTVSWDAVPDAASYTLYRSTVSGDYSSADIVSGLTETNQIDDTVSNGTRYFYGVTAIDGDGVESPFSEEVTAFPAGFGNTAPAFTADPVVEVDATEALAYTGTLADNATDGEGDTLYFAKLAGPEWLTIAEDGRLSGTPAAGDVGLNEFSVQVTATGGSEPATLQITVNATPIAPPPPVTLSVVEPFAYTAGLLQNIAATGTGLSGNWTARGTAHSVVDGSLTAPAGYGFTPAGGRLVYNSSWGGTKVSLSPAAQIHFNSDRVTYLSFLLNPGTSGGLFRLTFLAGSTEVGYVGEANIFTQLEVNLGSSDRGSTFPVDETVLVVAKIETSSSGSDTIRASFFSGTVGEEPTTWDAVASSSAAALIDAIEFYGSGAGGNVYQLDELRIGSTYNSVIGVGGGPVDADNDGMDDAWETLYFPGQEHLIDGSADSDNDDVPDFFEYLYGSNPTLDTSSGFALAVGTDSSGVSPRTVFLWTVQNNFMLMQDYFFKLSTDLVRWEPLLPEEYTVDETIVGDRKTLSLELTSDIGDAVFFRLEGPPRVQP